MAAKGPGASAHSLMILQRSSRLYEGERWWLFDRGDEVRGVLLFDGGDDLSGLREDIGKWARQGYRFCPAEAVQAVNVVQPAWAASGSGRSDCQVTVEERTQLFGFLKKG